MIAVVLAHTLRSGSPDGVLSGVSNALNQDGLNPGCNAADIAKPFGVLDLQGINAFVFVAVSAG